MFREGAFSAIYTAKICVISAGIIKTKQTLQAWIFCFSCFHECERDVRKINDSFCSVNDASVDYHFIILPLSEQMGMEASSEETTNNFSISVISLLFE